MNYCCFAGPPIVFYLSEWVLYSDSVAMGEAIEPLFLHLRGWGSSSQEIQLQITCTLYLPKNQGIMARGSQRPHRRPLEMLGRDYVQGAANVLPLY